MLEYLIFILLQVFFMNFLLYNHPLHIILHSRQTNILVSYAYKKMAYTIVSTVSQIAALLTTISIPTLATSPPSLYFDVEGINLSRHGSISILELYYQPPSHPENAHTYLIDIHILGFLAFSTPSAEGVSLKSILEAPMTPKVFFDVRTDSDALYAQFGINLAGIIDLQLMEVASRSRSKTHLKGLGNCIMHDLGLGKDEKQCVEAIKAKGILLFAPDKGGSYAVFNQRPMTEEIVEYCVQDVVYLPKLFDKYNGKLGNTVCLDATSSVLLDATGSQDIWAYRVIEASADRVALSQWEGFDNKRMDMKKGPW